MGHSSLFEQLLHDEQFIAWVRSGAAQDTAYWQSLVAKYPDQVDSLLEAKGFLIEHIQRRYSLSEKRNEELRRTILQNAQNQPSAEPALQPASGSRIKYLWPRAAAVLLLAVLSGWIAWWLINTNNESVYRTAYGEIKEIVLPDSSLVTLNANSSLEYRYDAQLKQRKIWLTGEAFFDVRKKEVPAKNSSSQSASFLVHVDDVSVQVLGTRFNVKHRGEQTQVVLEEGSIQLKMDELKETLLMQPDELVEVQQGSGKINQQLVEAQSFSAWKEGLLRFDGASFDEISRVLTDNYGLQLRFVDPQMSKQIQLRGVFPAENIDLLLEAIANVTGTSVQRQGEVVEYK